MKKTKIKHGLLCILAVAVALIWVFPILYMIVSSFKAEADVVIPGIIFKPTLENYQTVVSDTFFQYLGNSVGITIGTVLITTLLAVPAAYALVFAQLKNPNGIYFWFVSTTFLPAIAVIVPVYLIYRNIGLVDNPAALIIQYCGAGVPMMVWLVTNFFREIPLELVEAAALDGATRVQVFFKIMIPLVRNGVISAALLVFIITWNEFFFGVTLTSTDAATLPVYMSKYMTQQGYFWGKMCATGTLICIIPIILGFFTQKALVKGLTSGSVKG